ncbi:glycosyltransferase [Bacillus sp. FJAT-49705]|uniref:Glycosyltransferase n=1 Tax=Cytobacillus citreus TaxID=2833586 RepID=A0ABS5NS14_9BACI|nr:glycosyltransferase [Cytobacillus citreus]MBS4189933.1 glycosyltransferase [Cytobacillus citreus]
MSGPTTLILTARYGSGHLKAANVLFHELQQKGFEPVISDLFGESYPAFSTITQSLFMKSFSYGSSFYKWFYYGTNKLNSKGLSQFSRYLGRKRLLELIHEHQPNFIILTFPLHAAPFLIKKAQYSIPTYTVITDYCLHPYWINPLIDHYFVGSESVKSSLLKYKIAENRITVSGIPIRPEFEMPIHKETFYQKYNISPQKKVITVLSGAFGVLKNVKELCQLLLNHPDFQIIAISGYNENLYELLMPLTLLFPKSFRLLRYVEDIQGLFAISDCIITKPGGITLTEAAALQVPLILHNPLPGQEGENAVCFSRKGAALVSRSVIESVEHVKTLLQNKEKTQNMKKALKNTFIQLSASTIIDHAIEQVRQPACKTLYR